MGRNCCKREDTTLAGGMLDDRRMAAWRSYLEARDQREMAVKELAGDRCDRALYHHEEACLNIGRAEGEMSCIALPPFAIGSDRVLQGKIDAERPRIRDLGQKAYKRCVRDPHDALVMARLRTRRC